MVGADAPTYPKKVGVKGVAAFCEAPVRLGSLLAAESP